MSGRVERAVRRDLRALTSTDRQSGLAVLAVELAKHMDSALLPARDAATVAARLQVILAELLKNTARETTDGIDDLATRRATRRGTA